MPPGVASLSMKIIPLHWRGAGVGCGEREGPTPKAEAFCPSREGIFNYSPPLEGCRGGLWRTGRTHPEG
jgi:hypothetical protein